MLQPIWQTFPNELRRESSFISASFFTLAPILLTTSRGNANAAKLSDILQFSEIQDFFYSSVKPSKRVKKLYLIGS